MMSHVEYRKILLGRGAEAVVYLEHWLGLVVVCKHRVEKRYRLSHIDREIRKHRTISEAKCMLYARKLIENVPRVLDVDLSSFILRMEYIDGSSLRDVTARAVQCEEIHNVLELYTRLGRYVATLHSGGLIHGDLSLTNVLVKNGDIYLIDFGLSYRHSVGASDKADYKTIELCARDLNVLLRNVEANFARVQDLLMESFFRGYSEILGESTTRRVLARIKKIRSLARYAPR